MIFICFDSLDRKLHVLTVLNKSACTSQRCSRAKSWANNFNTGSTKCCRIFINFYKWKNHKCKHCLTFDLSSSSVLTPKSHSTWRGGHSHATVLATTSLSVDDRYFRHRLSSQSRGDWSWTRALSASFSTSRARLVLSQF